MKISSLIAPSLLLVCTSGTQAADLSYSPPLLISPLPIIDSWTGFYLGANGGFGTAQIVRDGVFGGFGEITGVSAGLQAGYNVQLGAAVLGVEGDLQAAHMSQTVNAAVHTIRYFGTLRAKAGWALNETFMPYVTGGVALAGAHHAMPSGAPGTTSPEAERVHAGWALGGGLEAKLTENISAKLEYLHLDLGRETYFPVAGASPTDVGISGNIVRAGFNYRF